MGTLFIRDRRQTPAWSTWCDMRAERYGTDFPKGGSWMYDADRYYYRH